MEAEVSKSKSRQEQEYETEFGRALVKAMHDLGLTNREFGTWVGLTQDAVNHYAKGRRSPNIGRAMLLAREAGFSLDALIWPEAKSRPKPASAKDGHPLDAMEPPRTPRTAQGSDEH